MVFKWLKTCLYCTFYHLCLLLHLYLLLIFKLFLIVKEYVCNPEMCMVESGKSEFQSHSKLHKKKIKSWPGQPEIISQRNSWKCFLSNTQKNLFLHDIFEHLGHWSYSFISYVSYCSPSCYEKVIYFLHNTHVNWCIYVYAFIFI